MRIPTTSSLAACTALASLAGCATSPRAVSAPAPTTTTASTTTTTTQSRTTSTTGPGGAFVVRLGADTVAVERYTRTANRVEGDIVNRSPSVRVTHYVADLDASGRPTRIEYASRLPNGDPLPPNRVKSVVLTFRNDSIFREIAFPDSVSKGAVAAPLGTVLNLANSYAMYEMALAPMRAASQSSGALSLYGGGGAPPSALKVSLAGNQATIDYFGDPIVITTDAAGRILAVDGSRSTNKVMAERIATADIAALASAFATRAPMGAPSPRDTVRATVGAAQLLIDYGRPSVRGRTVWGGLLVPYNAIWRTGANAATQLSTSTDLVIGGTTVPAGKYTLWTWAAPEGYQLVVNKQTGQWGTEYKADQDLARIPLTVTPLSTPAEQFTFAIDPTADGGTIRMMWGDKQLSVPFTVKK
jgi:hypothetical protein